MATAGRLNPLERPGCSPAQEFVARRERLFDAIGSGSRAPRELDDVGALMREESARLAHVLGAI